MRNRTVLIILGIAVVLLAFILLFERESMTTSELEGRKDRVFVEFRRESVERIAIRGIAGQKVELERTTSSEEGSEEWKIVSPIKLKADNAAVRGVLSAIDFLLKDRTVKGEDNAADPRYGLTEPRIEASFTIRGRTVDFRIGADTKDAEKVYLALDDTPQEFYAVEKEFLESMDLDLDDLRDKHLVAGSLNDAVAIRVQREAGGLELERDPGSSWRVNRGSQPVLAAQDQVAELLSTVGNLKADSFVVDDIQGEQLSKFGLDTPIRSVTVTMPSASGETRILFGNSCNGEQLVHATVAGSGTVACVSDDIFSHLDRPVSRMCEMRPAVFRDEEVSTISITRGQAKLELERDDDANLWEIAGKDSPEVEQAVVTDLLAALRESRATQLTVGEEAVAGLQDPTASIELSFETDQTAVVLNLWPATEAGQQVVRRGEEQALLTVPGKLLSLVSPDPLAFRKRTFEHGDRQDAVALEITGPLSQRLEKDGSAWKLVAPVQVEADGASARELAGLIAEMEVVRFVAEEPLPEHGLKSPWAIIAASFVEEKSNEQGKDRTGERKVGLEIGAAADPDTRFARIQGERGPVFIVGQTYIDVATRPLPARDLLQIDETKVVKLELSQKDTTLTSELIDDTWVTKSNSASSADIKRIVTDLGAMKAIRAAAFGVPEPSTADSVDRSMSDLRLRTWTSQQLDADQPEITVFGDKTSDPDEAGHFAWREGVDVTFVVPARIVEELIAVLTSPQS